MDADKKNKLFGQIAVKLGYITIDDVKDALLKQEADEITGKKKHLGTYFFEDELLTKEQISKILQLQKKYIEKFEQQETETNSEAIPSSEAPKPLTEKINSPEEKSQINSSIGQPTVDPPVTNTLPSTTAKTEIASSELISSNENVTSESDTSINTTNMLNSSEISQPSTVLPENQKDSEPLNSNSATTCDNSKLSPDAKEKATASLNLIKNKSSEIVKDMTPKIKNLSQYFFDVCKKIYEIAKLKTKKYLDNKKSVKNTTTLFDTNQESSCETQNDNNDEFEQIPNEDNAEKVELCTNKTIFNESNTDDDFKSPASNNDCLEFKSCKANNDKGKGISFFIRITQIYSLLKKYPITIIATAFSVLLLLFYTFGDESKKYSKNQMQPTVNIEKSPVSPASDSMEKVTAENDTPPETDEEPKNPRRNCCNDIFAAVQNGHEDEVNFFIKIGSEIDTENESGKTPLMLATEAGYEKIMVLLILYDAEISQDDKKALLDKHKDYVETIKAEQEKILNDEKPKKLKQKCCSDIFTAAQNGHEDEVKFFVNNGSDVNAKNESGKTPLMLAAEGGYKRIVVFLVFQRADHSLKDNDGNTAQVLATKKHKYTVANLLSQSQELIRYRGKFYVKKIEAEKRAESELKHKKENEECGKKLINLGINPDNVDYLDAIVIQKFDDHLYEIARLEFKITATSNVSETIKETLPSNNHSLLMTTNTVFSSDGRFYMCAVNVGNEKVKLKNGFEKECSKYREMNQEEESAYKEYLTNQRIKWQKKREERNKKYGY